MFQDRRFVAILACLPTLLLKLIDIQSQLLPHDIAVVEIGREDGVEGALGQSEICPVRNGIVAAHLFLHGLDLGVELCTAVWPVSRSWKH
jgi:hypothetical protein